MASRLKARNRPKQIILGDSAKTQKQITRLGELFAWGFSEINCRASSTDDFNTKALCTLLIFRGCHQARDFNSSDSKATGKNWEIWPISGDSRQYPAAKDVIERILATPAVQELLANRPSPRWPDLEQMAAMPKGSLGWCLHRRQEKLGITVLVDQSQIPESQSDEEFAKTRDIRLHDIHHTVLGFPITVAGEAAAFAFYASTRSAPTDMGILASLMLRGAYEPSERRLIWDAISFGIALGQIAPDLFSPRW